MGKKRSVSKLLGYDVMQPRGAKFSRHRWTKSEFINKLPEPSAENRKKYAGCKFVPRFSR